MFRPVRITARSSRPLAHVARSIALLGLCLGMPSMASAGYIFSEIKIPGATFVSGFGIQGNVVTGYYADASGNFHGFVDQGGVVTTVDAPTSDPGLSQTNLNHFNVAGIVGVNYDDANGVSQSALYNLYTKSWTLLPSIPGSMGSGANGVNINGTVVGSYTTADPSLGIGYHGFTYNGSSYSVFDAPTSDPVKHLGRPPTTSITRDRSSAFSPMRREITTDSSKTGPATRSSTSPGGITPRFSVRTTSASLSGRTTTARATSMGSS